MFPAGMEQNTTANEAAGGHLSGGISRNVVVFNGSRHIEDDMAQRSYRTRGKFLTSLWFFDLRLAFYAGKTGKSHQFCPGNRGSGLFKISAFGGVARQSFVSQRPFSGPQLGGLKRGDWVDCVALGHAEAGFSA